MTRTKKKRKAKDAAARTAQAARGQSVGWAEVAAADDNYSDSPRRGASRPSATSST